MRLDPRKMAANMTAEQSKFLDKLATSLKWLADSNLGGQELFYKLEALGLDNPEFPLCKMAGATDAGAILCCNCPFGPEAAGCMNVVNPIMLKALKGNGKRARLDLERLSHLIGVAIGEFHASKEQAIEKSTEI